MKLTKKIDKVITVKTGLKELESMNAAIVIGGRQELGFLFCEQLLMEDYTVLAFDYSLCQDETHEERWLYIGRNANLFYIEDDINEVKDYDDIQIRYVFVSLTDFYLNHFSNLDDQLITHLKSLALFEDCKKSTFVFIQPTSTDQRNSRLSVEIEQFKAQLTNKRIEYFIPSDHTKIVGHLFVKEDEKSQKTIQIADHYSNISSYIISDLNRNEHT